MTNYDGESPIQSKRHFPQQDRTSSSWQADCPHTSPKVFPTLTQSIQATPTLANDNITDTRKSLSAFHDLTNPCIYTKTRVHPSRPGLLLSRATGVTRGERTTTTRARRARPSRSPPWTLACPGAIGTSTATQRRKMKPRTKWLMRYRHSSATSHQHKPAPSIWRETTSDSKEIPLLARDKRYNERFSKRTNWWPALTTPTPALTQTGAISNDTPHCCSNPRIQGSTIMSAYCSQTTIFRLASESILYSVDVTTLISNYHLVVRRLCPSHLFPVFHVSRHGA